MIVPFSQILTYTLNVNIEFCFQDNNAGSSWDTTSYWQGMGDNGDPNPGDVTIPLLFVYNTDGGDIKAHLDSDPTLVLRLGNTEGIAANLPCPTHSSKEWQEYLSAQMDSQFQVTYAVTI